MSLATHSCQLAVVGAGPAGMCAALEASRAGVQTTVIDENNRAGGQLFKQIHRFFGSSHHGAGKRGYEIADNLVKDCLEMGIKIRLSSAVLGFFTSGELMVDSPGGVYVLRPEAVVIATGAMEKSLAFPGWTLPGVMGAGAAQTLVNVHGVLPGRKVLMAGSGNVGLIVAYQLLQAGAEVVGIIDIAGEVGGYEVHGERVRREGVPIYLRHRLVAAEGEEQLRAVVVESMEEGKIMRFRADTLCLAVGLSPLAELAAMRGCEMAYQPELGGFVPLHGPDMKCSLPGVYVAGDACGIEEASVAMEEGRLAGISAAQDLGAMKPKEAEKAKDEVGRRLENLRHSPYGEGKAEAKKRLHQRWQEIKDRSGLRLQ